MKIITTDTAIRIKPPLTTERSSFDGEKICIPVAVRGERVQPLSFGSAPDTMYEVSRAMRQGADVIILRGTLNADELNIRSADLHVQPEKYERTQKAAQHPAMKTRLQTIGQAMLASTFAALPQDADFRIERNGDNVTLTALGQCEQFSPEAALTVASHLSEKKNGVIYGELGTLNIESGKTTELVNEDSGDSITLNATQIKTLCQLLRVAALFPEQLQNTHEELYDYESVFS